MSETSAHARPPSGLTRAAVYERVVAASTERVWENVLDWEHLGWLHRTSFGSIELVDSGSWGWKVWIGEPRSDGGILLELVIEADAPRYVSRTLEGTGAGSEIWTQVDALGAHETQIGVEFWLAIAPGAAADELGRAHIRVYTRLWNEDESMMVRREQELAKRRSARERREDAQPFSLGTLEALRPRLPLVVELAGQEVRIVELDGVLHAHSTVCPHRLGPLAATGHAGRLACPWHGYTFDLRSGRECSGRKLSLFAAPRIEVDPENRQVWLSTR